MNNSIRLIVSTPFKEYYNLDIKSVTTESIVGKIEILPMHSLLISPLKPTLTEFEDINGKKYKFHNSKGIIQVTGNEVRIICEHIEENKEN
ncbi:F0F1 ATP synthase subunit epsilon [Clostridium liquoris]|jgi:F-type H+-transporting ATPase subunit epsilon|uniref:F0F1 ATP synthase subunit epsilon n=1 Tax=Clostridium liquoris TaxID=1289519 RepID=A0A2T0B965_9CLOT|nr:hypothetical protein [Clostridium liquoris]PRR80441.1 F0F1 ATP synthase subunit epsilon [Clostridium liquoris]